MTTEITFVVKAYSDDFPDEGYVGWNKARESILPAVETAILADNPGVTLKSMIIDGIFIADTPANADFAVGEDAVNVMVGNFIVGGE